MNRMDKIKLLRNLTSGKTSIQEIRSLQPLKIQHWYRNVSFYEGLGGKKLNDSEFPAQQKENIHYIIHVPCTGCEPLLSD